jgi:hypothetical protein
MSAYVNNSTTNNNKKRENEGVGRVWKEVCVKNNGDTNLVECSRYLSLSLLLLLLTASLAGKALKKKKKQ